MDTLFERERERRGAQVARLGGTLIEGGARIRVKGLF
jgi:hypothetical protein